jgi:hypothetical protein
MAVATPPELIAFLAPYPTDVQALMISGRRRLLALVGPATELLFDATSAVCAGFSYTGQARDNFLNLAAFPKHVTLVFSWGATLTDPGKVLKGEGSRVRHMRLASLADLKRPEVVKLIRQAAAKAPRLAVPLKKHGKVVKVYAGPKRRPKPSS